MGSTLPVEGVVVSLLFIIVIVDRVVAVVVAVAGGDVGCDDDVSCYQNTLSDIVG